MLGQGEVVVRGRRGEGGKRRVMLPGRLLGLSMRVARPLIPRHKNKLLRVTQG